MDYLTSKDGTRIAYEKIGQGPALVIVCGILGDHTQQAGLAQLLSEHFTVYNFDRRGHGESGFTEPHAVEREFEDLDTLLNEAGGSAFVYGTSGLGVLAMYAAAWGLSHKFKKLAIWEPPYILEGSGHLPPKDYRERLISLLSQGQRGDMVELFMSEAVGMPIEFVSMMRTQPWWPAQEAVAHTLIQNADIMGDFSMPKEQLAAVSVPTLVIDGGQTPWISYAAQAVATALPNAQRYTIAGQPHNVADEAMAPVLIEFFQS